MDDEKHWQQMLQYQPESWRDDGRTEAGEQRSEGRDQRSEVREQGSEVREQGSETRGQTSVISFHDPVQRPQSHPDVRDQTRVLELLGRVNYKIISGSRVYVEVGGVVYKTLYGGYWRSVFTGIEHYLLRCEQVSGSIWAEESRTGRAVDLPIVYSNEGWTASGHSLSFMLSRD